MQLRRVAARLPYLAFTLALIACDSDEPAAPPVPSKNARPRVTLERLSQSDDGLVRLRATWFDPDGPLVDPPIQVTIDDQAMGDDWIRRSVDGTYMDMVETSVALLSAGVHEIIARVSDPLGKTASDTLIIDLPYLTLIGSIPAEVHSQGPLVECGDSTDVFLGVGSGLLVIDAVQMTYKAVTNPYRNANDNGSVFLTCTPDEHALYIANGLQRFDIPTHTWSERRNTASGYAISPSNSSAGELFVGTSYGILSGYDRETGAVRREVHLPGSSPISQDAIVTIASAPQDARVFVTQFLDSTYVFDADWALQSRLPYALNWVELTSDGARGFGITTLIAPGVVELNPRTGDVLREHGVSNAWHLDVRPDDQVAFVSTVGRGGTGYSYLIDLRAGAFSEIARVQSGTWYEGGAAWLASRRRLVVFRSAETGSDHFDVYLDRS